MESVECHLSGGLTDALSSDGSNCFTRVDERLGEFGFDEFNDADETVSGETESLAYLFAGEVESDVASEKLKSSLLLKLCFPFLQLFFASDEVVSLGGL